MGKNAVDLPKLLPELRFFDSSDHQQRGTTIVCCLRSSSSSLACLLPGWRVQAKANCFEKILKKSSQIWSRPLRGGPFHRRGPVGPESHPRCFAGEFGHISHFAANKLRSPSLKMGFKRLGYRLFCLFDFCIICVFTVKYWYGNLRRKPCLSPLGHSSGSGNSPGSRTGSKGCWYTYVPSPLTWSVPARHAREQGI
jgi:hypothetical protein